jgi:hypothetical protein
VGSSGKKRTTQAKLNREGRLRDKRAEKQARKAARKLSVAPNAAAAAPRSDELGTASAGLDGGGPGGEGAESVAVVCRSTHAGDDAKVGSAHLPTHRRRL